MSQNDQRHAWWLRLVGDLLQQPLVELPDELIAESLTETFSATGSCWTHRAINGPGSTRPWPPGAFPLEDLAEIRLTLGDRQPLVHWYDVSGMKTPQSLGRVPSGVADPHSLAVWSALSKPMGIEHQLLIPLQIRGQDMRVFVSARDSADFSDADLELAALIQPVLTGLHHQVATLRRWKSSAGAAAADGLTDRLHDVRLTGREMAVLTLLAEGLTAQAIARRLHISVRTVSKHQEHLYAKLRTSDRLMTVLRAQHLGLLPEVLSSVAGGTSSANRAAEGPDSTSRTQF